MEGTVVDLSFVILTWNSQKYLESCFTSIIEKCGQENVSCEIIVIDNGSSDGTLAALENFRREHPEVIQVIALPHNTGTTYSRNLGLKQATGRFFCILDSDTEMGDGSLRQILTRLEQDKSLGIIAPRLLLPGEVVQNSVKRFPTFWHKLSKIPKAALKIEVPNFDFYSSFPFSEENHVDTAISACWFFRRDVMEKVGLLDEKIFYAPEDLDYCIRVWKAGFRVLYWPNFTVLHHTQQISHRKPLSKVSLSHFAGLLYYFRKHGGWLSARGLYRQIDAFENQ